MPELAGTNSIEYYLKGRALRQQREETEARTAIAQQQAELKAKQLDDAWKINEIKSQELKRYHDAQITKMKNDFEIASQNSRGQLAKLVADGILEADPDKPGAFRPTDAGRRAIILANEEKLKAEARSAVRVSEAQQMSPILASRAGAVAQAQLPARTNLAMIQSEIAGKAAQAQRDFTAEQNALNREAMYNRAMLAHSNRSTAKAEEKAQTITDTVDADLTEVMEGNITQEDLNRKLTGEAKVKVQNEFRNRGVRILKDEDKGNLSALQAATNFHTKLKDLEIIINKHSTPQMAALDPDYKSKLKEIQQDLDAWGRAVKGFKGMITERDTQRLEGGIPDPLPGGKLSVFQNAKKIREINAGRVKSIENFIQQRFNMMTSGMTKAQKDQIRKRFSIPSGPTVTKPKVYGPNNPTPPNLKRGEEVK